MEIAFFFEAFLCIFMHFLFLEKFSLSFQMSRYAIFVPFEYGFTILGASLDE